MQSEFERELIGIIPHLRAFARLRTRHADLADDLVQDTIVRALKARDQFQPGTNLKAWTFTILRNLHINYLRRRPDRIESLEDGALENFGVAAEQNTKLEVQEVREALSKLKPEYREVLILVGATGFRYDEAAAICQCAVGTIKSRLSRARDELFKRLFIDQSSELEGVTRSLEPIKRKQRSKTAAMLRAG